MNDHAVVCPVYDVNELVEVWCASRRGRGTGRVTFLSRRECRLATPVRVNAPKRPVEFGRRLRGVERKAAISREIGLYERRPSGSNEPE